MKINYEVNIYSTNTNEYLCLDNYFDNYEKALDSFNKLKETLVLGEELSIYKRTLNDQGEEIENEIIEYADGDDVGFNKVNCSIKNGDTLVFMIGRRVFISDTILKHKKEATIEFKDCYEVDYTCFEENGEYYGDALPSSGTIILRDPFADNPNEVATKYYHDEIVEGL